MMVGPCTLEFWRLMTLVIMTTSAKVTAQVCPVAGYVIFNGVCYKHFAEQKTYDDARQTCAADGGLVAMPKDNAINTFIHNLGPLSHYWIGLTDVDNEGQWVFEDGQTLESSGFSNWQPGEPNDALGREDCAEVLPSEHVWNDIPCTGTKRFVCQQISGLSGMTLDDAGMGHLSVSWTVVEGLPISRYRLRYQPADGSGSYRDLSPTPAVGATSATVRGLQADTDYNITLTSFGEDDQPNGVISGTYTTGPTTTHTNTTPRAQTEGPTTSPHLTGPIASPAVGAAMPSTYPTTTHTYTTPRAQTEVAATGTIVGIVIGVIAAIALTVALVYIFTRKMICGKGDEEHADVAPPVRSSSRRRTDNIYAVPMDTYHLPLEQPGPNGGNTPADGLYLNSVPSGGVSMPNGSGNDDSEAPTFSTQGPQPPKPGHHYQNRIIMPEPEVTTLDDGLYLDFCPPEATLMRPGSRNDP